MRAKKHFGQHFLHDDFVLQKIISEINPSSKDTMIEIGPGLGAMTKYLLPTVNKLTAIEIDLDCVHALENITDLTVIHQDALCYPWQSCPINTRVVGNLPYNVATEIFFACLQSDKITDMHFMMQKEVAARLVATPNCKAYGKLSVMMQMQANVTELFDIAPESFRPEPKVISTFCRIVPNNDPWVKKNIEFINKIVTMAFSQRRKQCHHNLKQLFSKQALETLGINPQSRAENLSINDYKKLVQSII